MSLFQRDRAQCEPKVCEISVVADHTFYNEVKIILILTTVIYCLFTYLLTFLDILFMVENTQQHFSSSIFRKVLFFLGALCPKNPDRLIQF